MAGIITLSSDEDDIIVIENPNRQEMPIPNQNPEGEEILNHNQNPEEVPVVQNPNLVDDDIQEIQNPAPEDVAAAREPEDDPEVEPIRPVLPEPTEEDRNRHEERSMSHVIFSDSEEEVDVNDPDRQLGLERDPDPVRRRFDREAADWPLEERFKALGINEPGPDHVFKKPLRDEPSMTFLDYKLLAMKDNTTYRYLNTEWDPAYLNEDKDKVVRFKMNFSGLETYNPPWYKWMVSDELKAWKEARAKEKREEKKKKREEKKKKGIVIPKRARHPTGGSGPNPKMAKIAEMARATASRESREERARRRRELVFEDTSGPSTSSRRRRISPEDSEASSRRQRDSGVSRSQNRSQNPGPSSSRRNPSFLVSRNLRRCPSDEEDSEASTSGRYTGFRGYSGPSTSSSAPRDFSDSDDEDPNVPGPSSAIYRRRR